MVNFGTLRRTWLEKIVTFHDCKHEKYCTEIYLMSMMMLILMMLVVLMVLRAASARGGCPNLELVVLRGKSKVGRVDDSRGARRNPKSPQMAPAQHSQMPFCAPRAKNHAITLHR